MTFNEFTQDIRHRADEALIPEMTVKEADRALAVIAREVIEETGGIQNLFATQPMLLRINVDTQTLRGNMPVGDILFAIADEALLILMDTVRNAKFAASFEDGLLAGIERTVAYVIEAKDHARGVITPTRLDPMEALMDGIADGQLESNVLLDGLVAAERVLKTLSIPGIDRIAEALGGREMILAHHDAAVKLLIIRSNRSDGFDQAVANELSLRASADIGTL